MRIGIYARVSTKDQSCEMQIRDLRVYCAARGFDLVREYVDVGQLGAKDSRPELNKLMDDARKRQFDANVVWRFDRFARSTKHRLLALEEFRSLGVQFNSYQENMDTSSPRQPFGRPHICTRSWDSPERHRCNTPRAPASRNKRKRRWSWGWCNSGRTSEREDCCRRKRTCRKNCCW